MIFITRHKTTTDFESVKDLLENPQLAYVEDSGKIYCWNSQSEVQDAEFLYFSIQGYTTDETILGGVFFTYVEDEAMEAQGLYKYTIPGVSSTYVTVKTRKISKMTFPYDVAAPVLYGFSSMEIPDETPLWTTGVYSIYGFVEQQTNRVVIDKAIGKNANGHEYVDLGLTSGTKWAKFNVGATEENIHGGLYQWGGLTDVTEADKPNGQKTVLNWNNCPFQTAENPEQNTTKWSKYISQNVNGPKPSVGDDKWDNEIKLELQHDVAHSVMGGDWHMPTTAQIYELVTETTSVWQTASESEYGVAGRLFTSTKNGNTIFIPASGYRDGSYLNNRDSRCGLWSSSLNPAYPSYAWYLYFYDSDINYYYTHYRYCGYSVRGVL